MRKLTIIGAGGVRTPLLVEAIMKRRGRIGITNLTLMDIDGERLDLIGALTAPFESSVDFSINRTTDPEKALEGASFVITTFRVGGIESRIIDEKVPLELGVLGQETTGPGGFAMAMRSLPALLAYIRSMHTLCPDAWLINFANPAGLLAEAAIRIGGWQKTAGICDAPSSMLSVASAILKTPPDTIHLDYFGLNHLGWIRKVLYNNHNYLPQLVALLSQQGGFPGFHIHPEIVSALNLIPNEYLYYFYNTKESVQNILKKDKSRAEFIAIINSRLFEQLREARNSASIENMLSIYQDYLQIRAATYMSTETGQFPLPNATPTFDLPPSEGYAGVALDLIEALAGCTPRRMILNIPNRGAIHGMEQDDVVEIPAIVNAGQVEPLSVGPIPNHCLGLVKQVKTYEKWVIEAAVEQSYQKARMALTLHPLVADYGLAGKILNGYIARHGSHFPELH